MIIAEDDLDWEEFKPEDERKRVVLNTNANFKKKNSRAVEPHQPQDHL